MSRAQRRSFMLALLPFLSIPGLAIWHVSVNAWGAAKVDEHLAFLESMGIPTQLKAVVPGPENPEDEAMSHPAIVAEFARAEIDRLNRITGNAHGHRIGGLAPYGMNWPNRWTGEGMDVRNFFDPMRHGSEAEAARELLDVFAPEHQRLKEIAVALARPKAGWRVELSIYDGIEQPNFPDLMYIKHLLCAFQEHALCALAIEDEQLAADFATAIHHACLHTARPPLTMLHYWVSRAYFHQWEAVVHEGIRRGAWSDASLAGFDAMLVAMPEDDWFIESLRGELGFNANILHQMKHGGHFAGHFVSQNPFDDWEWELEEIRERTGRVLGMLFTPRGILLKALVDDAREFHDLALFKDGAQMIRIEKADFDRIRRRREELGGDGFSEIQPTMVRTLAMLLEHHFDYRCSVALFQTGIALERHRLKFGEHPDSLDALVPEFLTHVPLDPYDGQPLRYRRRDGDGGSPLVWSVGQNGLDEGGKTAQNRDEGDRVWITSPLDPPPNSDRSRVR